MTLQTLEEKLKTLATKVELPFETALKYLHNQLDALIFGAENNATVLKTHIETVAAHDEAGVKAEVEKVQANAVKIEAEVKTDAAKIEGEAAA